MDCCSVLPIFAKTNSKKLSEKFLNSSRISEEHLVIALSQVKLGFWELNLKTRFIECTDQNRANFGFSRKQVLSEQAIMDAILPEDRWRRIEGVAAAMNPATPTYDFEIRVRHPDQRIRWLQVRGTVIFENEDPTRIIGTTLDISEKKGMELLRDEILNITTHELKSPLSVVRGYLQLLYKFISGIGNTKYQLIAERAISASEKVERLMDEAMKTHFQGQSEMIINKECVDLKQLSEEIISNARLVCPDVEINLHTQPLLPRVVADRYRIAQVMTNLINNAIKYSPGESVIDVDLSANQAEIRVSVSDNGIGIAAQEREKIFGKFYRVENSMNIATGSGIGLFLCSEILVRHNGKIGVLPKLTGKGTTAYFTLPI